MIIPTIVANLFVFIRSNQYIYTDRLTDTGYCELCGLHNPTVTLTLTHTISVVKVSNAGSDERTNGQTTMKLMYI